ncbi:hypothetical protein SAMN06265346_11688 [Flavobacterium hercynium]|nr:hypothetical protein SAMN06265346_11688 [Flavobacterium hercynium]
MTNKQIENKKEKLIKELKKGEKSEFVKRFDRNTFIKDLHKKHINCK